MFSRWFRSIPEPRPWERTIREEIAEAVAEQEDEQERREPSMTYRVEVGTTADEYSFESEKPILIADGPETVSVTIDDGESGTIKFYKRNLTFIQEFVPS